MLIECTLKRDAPISVPIGNDMYDFKPDLAGRQVCEVYKEDHIAAFLAVSNLYREVADQPASPAPASDPAKDVVAIINAMSRQELFEFLKARGIKTGAVVANADLKRQALAAAADAAAA